MKTVRVQSKNYSTPIFTEQVNEKGNKHELDIYLNKDATSSCHAVFFNDDKKAIVELNTAASSLTAEEKDINYLNKFMFGRGMNDIYYSIPKTNKNLINYFSKNLEEYYEMGEDVANNHNVVYLIEKEMLREKGEHHGKS